MRILWVAHTIPYPPTTGGTQRSYYLLRELARTHDVYFVGFNQSCESPQSAVQALSRFCKDVQIVAMKCRSGKARYRGTYWEGLMDPRGWTVRALRDARMKSLIQDIVLKQRIELVHFDTLSLAPYRLAARPAKTVLNHHNVESHMTLRRAAKEENLAKQLFWFVEGWKLRRYEKRVCRAFDLNLVCSGLDLKRLRRHVQRVRIEIVPNGVDLAYFHAGNSTKKEHSLVFAGGMDFYPNRDAMSYFATEVWPELKRSIPGVNMTVIGRDPPALLRALSDSDPNFSVVGYVDDIRPFLDRAQGYVCPVRDGGGTKLKVLNAMAMGIPIVADPIACEGLEVIAGEHVLFAHTPDEWILGVRRIFQDGQLSASLARNSQRLVKERYSFKDIGGRLSDLYGNTVAQAKSE